jgi:hypothetical protein
LFAIETAPAARLAGGGAFTIAAAGKPGCYSWRQGNKNWYDQPQTK